MPANDNGLGHCKSATNRMGAVSLVPARQLQVLLAEDTRALQKLAIYILGKRGHKVEIAEDGQQAVTLLCRRHFDVVLMDIQMPVMDGFQATTAIRQLSDATKANVPTVALTADGLGIDEERCLAAGMDAFVRKPIDRDELIEIVERLGMKAASGVSRGCCPEKNGPAAD